MRRSGSLSERGWSNRMPEDLSRTTTSWPSGVPTRSCSSCRPAPIAELALVLNSDPPARIRRAVHSRCCFMVSHPLSGLLEELEELIHPRKITPT
jgi:hypothetical protein